VFVLLNPPRRSSLERHLFPVILRLVGFTLVIVEELGGSLRGGVSAGDSDDETKDIIICSDGLFFEPTLVPDFVVAVIMVIDTQVIIVQRVLTM
jgi:hypothetical protein